MSRDRGNWDYESALVPFARSGGFSGKGVVRRWCPDSGNSFAIQSVTVEVMSFHRSGKRPNPAWDVLGESFTFMLDRALLLLNN